MIKPKYCTYVLKIAITRHCILLRGHFLPKRHLTFVRNLCHLNEDGVTELAKLGEGLHPAADVHFVFFSYLQTIDCLLSVRLHLQLKTAYKNNKSQDKERT